jgi:excisionase family DNA binding protein
MSESSQEEEGMAPGHLMDTYSSSLVPTGADRGHPRLGSVGLVHLEGMDTHIAAHDAIEPVLTLSELAAVLSVSVQTLYDLRSKGRGPRGFRVGRELRFRRSEVDSWLARLEAADGHRHPSGAQR